MSCFQISSVKCIALLYCRETCILSNCPRSICVHGRIRSSLKWKNTYYWSIKRIANKSSSTVRQTIETWNANLPGISGSLDGCQSSDVYTGFISICSLVSRTNASCTVFPLTSFAASDSHFAFSLTSFFDCVEKIY